MTIFSDSHCHLDHWEHPEEVMERAQKAGVGRVVAVAEDRAGMEAVLALKRGFPGRVLAGLGFHPMLTPSRSREEVEEALAFLADHLEQADVVGEIGLDYLYAETPEQQAWQQEVLSRQMALAARAGKPVNLHSRRSHRQCLERAVEFTRAHGLGAQLHWFTHSAKLVRLANQALVYCSVGPSLLLDPAQRQVAAVIDRDLLLLETDSPVEFPRGTPAEPCWVPRVAEVVAQLWDSSLEEVSRRTEANLERYLGLGRPDPGGLGDRTSPLPVAPS